MAARKKAPKAKEQTNEFRKALQGALKRTRASALYEEARGVLEEVAVAIHEEIFKGNPEIAILLEPGYEVNLGRQFNVVIAKARISFRDTLFRAYIPRMGYPVTLDFYGESGIPCDREEELRMQLVLFLNNEDVRGRLRDLHSLLTGEAASTRPKRRLVTTGGGRRKSSAA